MGVEWNDRPQASTAEGRPKNLQDEDTAEATGSLGAPVRRVGIALSVPEAAHSRSQVAGRHATIASGFLIFVRVCGKRMTYVRKQDLKRSRNIC